MNPPASRLRFVKVPMGGASHGKMTFGQLPSDHPDP